MFYYIKYFIKSLFKKNIFTLSSQTSSSLASRSEIHCSRCEYDEL